MKRIPPALLLGLCASALLSVVEVVNQLDAGEGYWPKLLLVAAGLGCAYRLLAIFGLVELARGRGHRIVVGANLAIAGIAIELATTLTFDVLAVNAHWMTQSRAELMWYAYPIAVVAQVVGLAIAARVSLPIAIGAVALGILSNLPPILARPIYDALHLDGTTSVIVHGALELVAVAVLIALAAVACRDRVPSPDLQRAIVGLRRASTSFWLRLIAALAIPAATLLFALGAGDGRDVQTIMRMALITTAFAALIAVVVFAVGAIRASQAGIADLNGIVLLVGGALAWWCAGVELHQLPDLYRTLYGGEDYGHYAAESAQAFPILLPVVGIAAVTAVVTAIHRFASRRAFDDLTRHAATNGTWFVAFSLTSVAIQTWLLPSARTNSGAVIMLLILAVSGIVTNVAMARLCERAAAAIDREPGLPTATVVSGPRPEDPSG